MIKKTFLFFIAFILFFSKTVFAQSLGYNIVNNFFNPDGSFNDKAFELIANQNPNATVTVRLTSGELRLYPNLVSLIENAAQKYGIGNIIWQPEDWSATTPQQFNDFWVGYLSQITMGEISLFTEYNYHYGSPENYAQILISALNAGFQVPIASTNFNTTNPTGSNPFGGQMIEYVEFLRQVQASCASAGRASCLNEIPVWSVSIYSHFTGDIGAAVDDFINQFNSFKNALLNLGVDLSGKRFIIPEVGLDPSLPIDQRLAAAAGFITALEARIHGDVELSGLISSMTFLFMDDKTGKQYLIIKINGQWVVVNYEDYDLVGLSGSPIGGESQRIGSAHGRSFIAEKTVCWDNFDEAVSAVVRALDFNISQNDKIAENLKVANSLLIPPGIKNKDKAEESQGEITFEVCQNNTRNWFTTEDSIKISVPESYMQASTNGVQVGGYFSPKGVDSTGIAFANPSSEKSNGPVIAAPQGESGDFVSIASFSCSATSWQVGCTLVVDAGYYGHVWVEANGQFLGINAVGRGLTYYYNANVGGEKPSSYTISAQVTNHDVSPKLSDGASCTIVFDARGNGTCSGSGTPLEPPEPPLCVPRDNSGEPMEYEGRDTSGVTRIPMDHGLSLEGFLEQIGLGFGVCKSVEFVFTPVTSVPYTFPDEKIQRENIYRTIAPPGSEDKYMFKHGETQDTFEASGRDSSVFDTALDIFGQKGVKKAHDQTIHYLLPSRD